MTLDLVPIMPTTTAALDPATDVLAHNYGNIFVVANSALPRWKSKKGAVRCCPASMPLLHHPGIIRKLLGEHDLVSFAAIT